jgi:hypothetical protein
MRRVIEDLIEKRKTRRDELKASLSDLAAAVSKPGLFSSNSAEVQANVSRFQEALERFVTAQDKEWDAYASNHATTVFKSLEWKIEKLEAEYSNLSTLLVHFAQLENRLDRLLESFDRRPGPETAAELRSVKEQLSPIQYADFEKRFRGSSEEISRRLARYLPQFPAAGEILDIGCGRGEFLMLLRESGRRGAFVASGALSHRLVRGPEKWPLPEDRERDGRFASLLALGEYEAARQWLPEFADAVSAEMGGRHLAMMLGVLEEAGSAFDATVHAYGPSSGSGNYAISFAPSDSMIL